ncbi:MAG: hypothetical protein LUG46_06090 [Erysipelotrichaceae bacterium]|nr:hypothetical protein [Erysipelotrichaceae bacterium]
MLNIDKMIYEALDFMPIDDKIKEKILQLVLKIINEDKKLSNQERK